MFITQLLTLQNQIRIYHWQTKSYAEHKALGKLYEALDPLIDEFIEVYMGKNGMSKIGNYPNIKLLDYSPGFPNAALNSTIEFIEKEISPLLTKEDTDLMNIRDSMLSAINRTKYLLTLE